MLSFQVNITNNIKMCFKIRNFYKAKVCSTILGFQVSIFIACPCILRHRGNYDIKSRHVHIAVSKCQSFIKLISLLSAKGANNLSFCFCKMQIEILCEHLNRLKSHQTKSATHTKRRSKNSLIAFCEREKTFNPAGKSGGLGAKGKGPANAHAKSSVQKFTRKNEVKRKVFNEFNSLFSQMFLQPRRKRFLH